MTYKAWALPAINPGSRRGHGELKHREIIRDGVKLWLACNCVWCFRAATQPYTLPPVPIGQEAPVIEAQSVHGPMSSPWRFPLPPETEYSTSITNAINSIVASSSS
jgi:hypothetical protein